MEVRSGVVRHPGTWMKHVFHLTPRFSPAKQVDSPTMERHHRRIWEFDAAFSADFQTSVAAFWISAVRL